jgi:hypothetical protein
MLIQQSNKPVARRLNWADNPKKFLAAGERERYTATVNSVKETNEFTKSPVDEKC